jgi:hypothetical protein
MALPRDGEFHEETGDGGGGIMQTWHEQLRQFTHVDRELTPSSAVRCTGHCWASATDDPKTV